MSHAGYFRLLKLYSDIWARRHCRVVLAGEETLDAPRDRGRVYIVSHPTTWDLPMLAHIGRNNFYVIVDKGPFAHPLVNWLFKNSGFLKLEGDNGDEVIRKAADIAGARLPLIISLKGYGVDFGEEVRPRTGGIRIAHYAKADIHPVHLMIENGKRIMKGFKGAAGQNYPFTVFHDTFYFATFCAPLRYDEYARDTMTYEDYKAIAYKVEATFNDSEKKIQADLAAGRFDGLPRKGGAKTQIRY
jgi:1-acyl-sn-glycerol-3-phosphate acyltransferase